MADKRRLIALALGGLALLASGAKTAVRTPAPPPPAPPSPVPPRRAAPPPPPQPVPGVSVPGEVTYAVPEYRNTDQNWHGWEKTGKNVLYVPSVQAPGLNMMGTTAAPPNCGAYFSQYGAPSKYWADLSQWEWSNAPSGIFPLPQMQRCKAAYDRMGNPPRYV